MPIKRGWCGGDASQTMASPVMQVSGEWCTGKLPCPTCRELTTLPPSGVAGLRNDFKIQKMEDLFRSMYVRQQQQQQQSSSGGGGGGTQNGSVCSACQAQKKVVEVHNYVVSSRP